MKKKTIKNIFKSYEKIAISIVLVAEMAVLSCILIVFAQNKRAKTDSISSQFMYSIESKSEQIEYVASELAVNPAVIEWTANGSANLYEIKKDVYKYMACIPDGRENTMYAFIIDKNGNGKSITNNLNSSDGTHLIDYTKNFLKDKTGTGSYIYITNNEYNELYLCSYVTIKKYNYSELINESIGMQIVCTKINLNKIISEIDKENNGIKITAAEHDNNFTEAKHTWIEKYIGRNAKIQFEVYNTDMTIVCTIPYSDGNILNIAVYCLVLLVILFIGVDIYKLRKDINHEVLVPISDIVDYMDNYNMFEKREKLSVSGVKEIEKLADHVTLMLDDVKMSSKQLIIKQQQLYDTELSKQEYQYRMLQNEINPHFMYNTLNCIYSMAITRDEDDISEMCASLSVMMQYGLENESIVTFEEEIKIVEKYISIMEKRFQDMVDFEINIPDYLKHRKVIRMTIQPIVENAFNHGRFYKKKNGILKIGAYREGNKFVITVYDNGNGISSEKTVSMNEELNKNTISTKIKGGIGISNINNRIKSEFGDGFGIRVSSEEGKYTLIKIIYPF